MTNKDILSAAFRVWGRELYKTTSLSKLARALEVSKPALYRHFPGKQSLQKAMQECFFDDYSAALKTALEEAQKKKSWQENLLAIIQFVSGYFARHFDFFIFAIIGLHDSKQKNFLNTDALKKRGVSFDKIHINDSKQFPSAMLLAGVTAFFCTAAFHRRRHGWKDVIKPKLPLKESWFSEKATEAEINRSISAVSERVSLGLQFNQAIVNRLPYQELEKTEGEIPVPPDPLLKAVAEVVAEEGPWNASMETVAKRSGLSKSGLYAHFKSKEDMLSRLFMCEFDRLAQCTTLRTASGKNREERLYLAILSIADYLRARPEILIALDWVRTQQLELDLSSPVLIDNFFKDLNIGLSAEDSWESISHWVLFLLIAVLKHYSAVDTSDHLSWSSYTGKTRQFDYRCLRRLFRFLCLGIKGLE